MAKLFHAGIVAACRQAVAVLALTSVVFLLMPSGGDANSSLLTLCYLLVAGGLAFTTGRSVKQTATRLRQASYATARGTSTTLLTSILAQFGLATVLCALLALFPPAKALF